MLSEIAITSLDGRGLEVVRRGAGSRRRRRVPPSLYLSFCLFPPLAVRRNHKLNLRTAVAKPDTNVFFSLETFDCASSALSTLHNFTMLCTAGLFIVCHENHTIRVVHASLSFPHRL